MKTERLRVGQLQTNCYLVWEEKTKQAAIIDPGDDADFIIRKIQDLKLKPQFILATHGHFDHLLAATELKLAFKIPFLISQADLFLVKRASQTSQFFTKTPTEPLLSPDKFIQAGDQVDLGKESLKVIATPGHTPGSLSFYTSGHLFSGDLIFKNGVGRTDFSYSSETELKKSIAKIKKLSLKIKSKSSKTKFHPGHGEEFT